MGINPRKECQLDKLTCFVNILGRTLVRKTPFPRLGGLPDTELPLTSAQLVAKGENKKDSALPPCLSPCKYPGKSCMFNEVSN